MLCIVSCDRHCVKSDVSHAGHDGHRFVFVSFFAPQYSRCQVGGNPNPNLQGCLIDSGFLAVPEFQLSLPYTYEPENDNFSFRAFEGFSIYAKNFMAECEGNCPYAEFQKFTNYYDVPDYGDELISAAFSGESTLMLNGNMDFGLFGDAARAGMETN